MSQLKDQHGRTMRKLRVSLLEACNFRCTYCMPEDATFAKAHNLLSVDEIGEIVGNLVRLGIEEVRVTGGEPTLRAELPVIMERLSELPLQNLGLTTNAYLLKPLLRRLKATKLRTLNISLDSIQRERFRTLARVDGLGKVIDAIDEARALGFSVKLNTVLMRSNFSELEDLIEFARVRGAEIRFLETMKIGVATKTFAAEFVPAREAIRLLEKSQVLTPLSVPTDSTAFKYRLDNGATVGFIASESMPFCGSCSRLRLGIRGELRACLMKEDSLSLRGKAPAEYPEIISQLLRHKPIGRVEEIEQPMYQIGG